MIEWIKNILGLKSETDKKYDQMKKLHEKAFHAQRKGDLSLAGDYQKQAQEIADSIEHPNK